MRHERLFRERPARLTLRGRITAAFAFLLLLLLIPLAGAGVYLFSVGFIGTSDPGPTVEIVIPEGAGTTDIARLLEEHGVIKSATGFRIAAFLDDDARRIQAGRYELPTGLSARDALTALQGGALLDFVMVTFREGWWLTEFAQELDETTHIDGDEFLALATDTSASVLQPDGVRSMEGLLFPSTYQVIEDDTAESVLSRLAEEFVAQISAIDFARVKAMGYSRYEAVIVASMVEAEAAVDEDRGRIAQVIYNRLGAGIPLGIDATIVYALGERSAVLTKSDLAIDSPYNSRRFAGLPPTPIGAPGAASLEAAASPPAGDWLYFVVADCDGHHAFSSSYRQFLRDKAAYRALEC